ncbi:MAG: hypothetical protein KBT08_05380 [Bacteroidales bacterium]|nr:hypothetical protein [Candidatus Cryptobacteroides onthequi]
MASIAELIAKQVASAAGNIDIPSAVKNQVLNGVSESILGSLTQTAAQAGGIDVIKALVTGKQSAASSPITALAGKLLAGKISGLGLNSAQNASVAGLVPAAVGLLSKVIKDQDGDGDVDLNDILITLKGGNKSAGAGILGAAAKSILTGILKK